MTKNTNRTTTIRTCILSCVFVFFIIFTPFAVIMEITLCKSAVYGQTFYGELACMYDNLQASKTKKIVIVGNSAVAFGVNSALAEKLLNDGGIDCEVCNFGLYGAIGTRAMVELCSSMVNDGDIVILSPELASQPLSNYFSAEEVWRALDSDPSMFWQFSSESKKSLVGGFFGYASDKFSGEEKSGSGIYSSSSFDANCDLTNYERNNSIMQGGVDSNNPIELSNELINMQTVSVINEWADELAERGAIVYYSFSPMNSVAVVEKDMTVEALEYYFASNLSCKLLGSVSSAVMESGWFYDSNFHLNSSGAIYNTVRIVNDIKTALGVTSKTDFALPDMPAIPDSTIEGEGENTDSDCFTYELRGSRYYVTGLTESGKSKSELVIPYQVDGVYISGFDSDVFKNDTVIEKITIQSNISTLSDNSFYGCSRLEEVVLCHDKPSDVSVGYYLLDGANSNCRIGVKAESLSAFKNDYFWSKYAKRLFGY